MDPLKEVKKWLSAGPNAKTTWLVILVLKGLHQCFFLFANIPGLNASLSFMCKSSYKNVKKIINFFVKSCLIGRTRNALQPTRGWGFHFFQPPSLPRLGQLNSLSLNFWHNSIKVVWLLTLLLSPFLLVFSLLFPQFFQWKNPHIIHLLQISNSLLKINNFCRKKVNYFLCKKPHPPG